MNHTPLAIAISLTCAGLFGCQPACPSAIPAAPQPPAVSPAEDPAAPARTSRDAAVQAIGQLLDDWHAAAAAADESAYFGFFSDDAVFLGTDASERWGVAAFRAYAHPHFAKGKAWSFRASRRAIVLAADGRLAWFDEDLVTPNLGPARGSGVVRWQAGGWRIAHYNLTITVPNERFDEVKELLASPAPLVPATPLVPPTPTIPTAPSNPAPSPAPTTP